MWQQWARQEPHNGLGDLCHLSGGSAGLQEEAQAWADFGLSLLPWPASAAFAWLLQSGAKQHVGRAPTPPKSVAIIVPTAPRDAAFTRHLAQCILWMAEAGLVHICIYDPQGVAAWHVLLTASIDSLPSMCRCIHAIRQLQNLAGCADFSRLK